MSDILNDQALDYFCAELTRIDKLGSNRQLIFTIPSTEGDQWKRVQVKLIIPADHGDAGVHDRGRRRMG